MTGFLPGLRPRLRGASALMMYGPVSYSNVRMGGEASKALLEINIQSYHLEVTIPYIH